MKKMIFIAVAILAVLLIKFMYFQEIRYVALGDSYTIGEGVEKNQSWPSLLVKDLNNHDIKIRLVANLAETGKATTEVISEQLPEFDRLSPAFATLLVGVNDYNRDFSIGKFQENLVKILNHLQAKLPSGRLVVLTIPDFSVTPRGKTFGNPAGNSAGIAAFNEVIKTETAKRNLPVVDVYPLSQQVSSNQQLVSSDQLHPSAKEYQLWEKEIFPTSYNLLRTRKSGQN